MKTLILRFYATPFRFFLSFSLFLSLIYLKSLANFEYFVYL